MPTLQQIQQNKALALQGIVAANAKVQEWKDDGKITEEMAMEVRDYLQAALNGVEALTPGVKY